MAATAGQLWASVDDLVARMPGPNDVASHRVELFEARRLRSTGAPVPPALVERERRAAVGLLCVPVLLRRVRAAYDGSLLILKGPEVARHYPDHALREYGDVDLLADDAPRAQASLLKAGFRELGDPARYRDIHHLRPLAWPGLPVVLELHSRPKWLDGLQGPSAADVLERGLPSAVGVDGFLALPCAPHAVLVAVHSWAHEPLRRLRDLVDVAVLAEASEPEELSAAATEWGVERLWATTAAAVDFLFYGERKPLALHVWGQNVAAGRERTVLENHLQRWLSDLWALPPHRALARMPRTLREELWPKGETWRRKLSRTALAVRNAFTRRSEHDREFAAR